MNNEDRLSKMLEEIEREIRNLSLPTYPAHLYDPIRYFLALGGKRLRPILALLHANTMAGDYQFLVLPSLSIELFHNFTLVHDDIMDKAPLRRGQPTVHEKWNGNIGLLSGDALFVIAYRMLEHLPAEKLPRIMMKFNTTALEVCEGQQLDMDFETLKLNEVSLEMYLEMIRLKTAVLLGFSAYMGACACNASEEVANRFYNAAVQMGISFQIQDDILDTYGDTAMVGKRKGGDILMGKKTILSILTANELSAQSKDEFLTILHKPTRSEEEIEKVIYFYDKSGAYLRANDMMQAYYANAMKELDEMEATGVSTTEVKHFYQNLINRKY